MFPIFNSTNFPERPTLIEFTILKVNQRFQNSLQNDPDLSLTIKLSNLLFLVTKSDSNWTSIEQSGVEHFPKYKGREVISVKSAYESFMAYVDSLYLPFEYDHAIGFTNKDIWSEASGSADERSALTGYSTIGGICQKSRYSIVEERGGFASVRVSLS